MEKLKQKLIDYLMEIDLKDKDILYVKDYTEVLDKLNKLSSADRLEKLFKELSEKSNSCCYGFNGQDQEKEV